MKSKSAADQLCLMVRIGIASRDINRLNDCCQESVTAREPLDAGRDLLAGEQSQTELRRYPLSEMGLFRFERHSAKRHMLARTAT